MTPDDKGTVWGLVVILSPILLLIVGVTVDAVVNGSCP